MAQEVSCPAANCGFSIRADDEHEIQEIVKEHAREKHGENYTDEQISDLMERA